MGKYLFLITLIFLPLCIFAGGVPEMETEIFLSQPPQYISPGNVATGKAVLKIENIQISIQESTSIRRYELRVYNKRGEVIYSVAEENLEGRGFFEELFDIGEYPSVSIPQSIIWDGRDSGGNLVEDGEYFYQLYVRDSNDKQTSTPPLAVVVDTVAPEIVSLNANVEVFSPNNDDRQDSISFFMQAGPAQSWTLEVQNAANEVVASDSRVSKGDTAASDVLAPAQFIWEGQNAAGRLEDDGNYRFLLKGVDRAGNVAEQEVRFALNNLAANINLSIEGDNPWFAPAVRDLMNFRVFVNDTAGIQSWKLELQDGEGIVFRRFAGTELPTVIPFNGKGNPGRPESDSLPFNDGEYQAIFSATYANGNVSTSHPVTLIVDSVPPEAHLAADSYPIGREIGQPIYFGGVKKPQLVLNGTIEEGVDWDVVVIYQEKDEFIVPLQDFISLGLDFPFSWDGTDPFGGQALPDGAYQIFLRAVDVAGNEGISDVARFIKDGSGREGVFITFSIPEAGVVRITPVVPVTEGIEHFILSVVNEKDGRTYFERPVRQVIPYVDWRGERNNGSPSPLGNYRVTLDILYLNGDNITAESAFAIALGSNGPTLDRLALDQPQGEIILSDALLSPDGDGVNDTANIKLITDTTAISSWKVEILDPYSNVFKKWDGNGSPPQAIVWDGTGDTGELVQSAAYYTVVLALKNEAGNEGIASNGIMVDILVTRDGDRVKINVPSIYFASNTSNLFDVDPREQEQNFTTLRRLAEILNNDKYRDKSIAVEGHAAHLLFGEEAEEEHIGTLIPLSRNRALEVKQALSILGVDWERMTVKGLGGSVPVPDSAGNNRWKNRRVEFILD